VNQDKNRSQKTYISTGCENFWGIFHVCLPTLHMVRVTQQMIRHDWLNSYRDLDNIGFALDRIAQRIRFPNRFPGIITEIKAHDQTLEAHFLTFFPELMEFYENLQLSTGRNQGSTGAV
jgi:acyl carrier protein phosphodiesterase